MASRLQKLLDLLKSGSAPSREQAARRLIQICDEQYEEYANLLPKLEPFLFAPSWDTRIAAASAFSGILKSVAGKIDMDSECMPKSDKVVDDDCADFKLENVLSESPLLDSGAGIQDPADIPPRDADVSRKNIEQALGLNPALGVSAKDLVKDEDLEVFDETDHGGPSKKPKLDMDIQTNDQTVSVIVKAEKKKMNTRSLCSIISNYIDNALDPSWTKRHGCALALRAFVQAFPLKNSTYRMLFNRVFKIACKVLVLDRFCDFKDSHVYTPVKDICAEIFAVVARKKFGLSVKDDLIAGLIAQFLDQKLPWECRYSGLLCLKYIGGFQLGSKEFVKPEITDTSEASSIISNQDGDIGSSNVGSEHFQLTGDMLENTFHILESTNDDLVRLAAEVCIRFKAAWLHSPEHINRLLVICRKSLAACASDEFLVPPFLTLYHVLADERLVSISDSVADLAYLLPLLHSSMVEIRRLSLELLKIKACDPTLTKGLCGESLLILMRILFQRLLCEPKEQLRAMVCSLWETLVQSADQAALKSAVCPFFGYWLSFLMISPAEPILDPSIVYSVAAGEGVALSPKMYICGEEIMALSHAEKTEKVEQVQHLGAQCLCQLVPIICSETPNLNPSLVPVDTLSPVESLISVIKFHLESNSYHQQRGCSMLLYELANTLESCSASENGMHWDSEPYAGGDSLVAEIRTALQTQILTPLTAAVPANYDEIVMKVSELNGLCRQMVEKWADLDIDLPEPPSNSIFSADQALTLLNLAPSVNAKAPNSKISESQQSYQYTKQLAAEIKYVQVTSKAWLAALAVKYELTPFLTNNSFIRPLFDAVKMVRGPVRDVSARVLVKYILHAGVSFKFVPRFVNNLMILLADDATITPKDIRLHSDEPTKIMCQDDRTGGKTGPPIGDKQLIVDNFVYHEGAAVLLDVIAKSTTDLKSDWPDVYNLLFVAEQPDLTTRRLLQQLQVIESIAPDLDRDLLRSVISQKSLITFVSSDLPAVRHMACRTLVALANNMSEIGLNEVILPTLVQVFAATRRLDLMEKAGTAELIWLLLDRLKHKMIGYLPLFALDVLKLMSDPTESVRQVSAESFASIVSLFPLEVGATCPQSLPQELKDLRSEKLRFIDQLMGGLSNQRPKLDLPFQISFVLRRYQEDGINWLWFLNQYGLHGILADDMGLGKTAMTLCLVMMSHHNRLKKNKPNLESKCENCCSLIIAPASVVGHWAAECEKLFVDNKPVILYLRNLKEAKMADVQDFERAALVFTSYDDFRKNSTKFIAFEWHYVVLDEGHVIKNPKSELFTAIMFLSADHRLILTGTPIQNSVVELWSAFRFLMPGYLGTQKAFNSYYTKPIEKTKAPKVTEADFAAGQKALNLLHKLVLPFILRRLKTAVLQDLPPKIIQDFYCDLTPSQRTLYDDYLHQCQEKAQSSSAAERVNPLNMLRYLRKLCNHPCLVDGSTPKTLSESGKLLALREVLQECGIGQVGQEGAESPIDVVCPHRALIFCQFKPVVQLLEDLMDKGQFGPVCWDKLDGSVPPSQRQAVVDRFNTDPSVDVLILTTQVGGLGLNLTAADVVIFMDQDWNPARDLQAMDRAHRLGQIRTVTVYRIIARDTVEQRVRQLQVSKVHMADTVVGDANQDLASMATDQLLDLLQVKLDQRAPESESDQTGSTMDIDRLWGDSWTDE